MAVPGYETFDLKVIGIPKYYLGKEIMSGEVEGNNHLTASAKTYIKRLTEKVKRLIDWKLKNYNSPEDPTYHLELDKIKLLNEEHHNLEPQSSGSFQRRGRDDDTFCL